MLVDGWRAGSEVADEDFASPRRMLIASSSFEDADGRRGFYADSLFALV